jgi:hypothetical protein
MTHDKIKAAARKRMAETGESYAAARRGVIGQFQAAGNGPPPPPPPPLSRAPSAGGFERLAMSYDGMDAISRWADTRMGGGPSGGRVELDASELRLRMADFKVDVPRTCVRSVTRSRLRTRSIGVHTTRRGSWLANGSAHGLVEITIDPPVYTYRSLSTLFRRAKVNALIVSLVDPDGFIAAFGGKS